MDLSRYFDMGGYAAYIWPAYLLTVVVMVGLLLVSWRGVKSRESELAALQRFNPRRRAASVSTDKGLPS